MLNFRFCIIIIRIHSNLLTIFLLGLQDHECSGCPGFPYPSRPALCGAGARAAQAGWDAPCSSAQPFLDIGPKHDSPDTAPKLPSQDAPEGSKAPFLTPSRWYYYYYWDTFPAFLDNTSQPLSDTLATCLFWTSPDVVPSYWSFRWPPLDDTALQQLSIFPRPSLS